jgi:hypothetical protein
MTDCETPEHVPDDAEPFIDPDGPTPGYALFGNLWLTDDAIYLTGVHCRQCGCGVARIDREGGVTTCPDCGWSSAPDDDTDGEGDR